MNARRLSLKRESLSELVADELRAVAGGSVGPTCYTCLVTNCAGVCNTRVTEHIPEQSLVCLETIGGGS